MYVFDLQSKLKQLNTNLYVDQRFANWVKDDFWVCGIYLRGGPTIRQKLSTTQMVGMDATRRSILEAGYKGLRDRHVGGCNKQYVPEYDIFDLESGEMLAEGWRTITCSLAKRGFISLAKARKVFNAPSLGEQDYDRLSFYEKLDRVRKASGYRH
jgi:uncharacterized protein (UPF0262 family)